MVCAVARATRYPRGVFPVPPNKRHKVQTLALQCVITKGRNIEHRDTTVSVSHTETLTKPASSPPLLILHSENKEQPFASKASEAHCVYCAVGTLS